MRPGAFSLLRAAFRPVGVHLACPRSSLSADSLARPQQRASNGCRRSLSPGPSASCLFLSPFTHTRGHFHATRQRRWEDKKDVEEWDEAVRLHKFDSVISRRQKGGRNQVLKNGTYLCDWLEPSRFIQGQKCADLERTGIVGWNIRVYTCWCSFFVCACFKRHPRRTNTMKWFCKRKNSDFNCSGRHRADVRCELDGDAHEHFKGKCW